VGADPILNETIMTRLGAAGRDLGENVLAADLEAYPTVDNHGALAEPVARLELALLELGSRLRPLGVRIFVPALHPSLSGPLK
jgi:hypothetical protein